MSSRKLRSCAGKRSADARRKKGGGAPRKKGSVQQKEKLLSEKRGSGSRRARKLKQKQENPRTEKSGGDDVMPFVQPDTRTVFYRVVASDEDIQAIDMALDSIGVYYERRDG